MEVQRLTGGQNLYAGAQLCRGAAGRESGQWISESASNMHAHNVHINRRSKQWPGVNTAEAGVLSVNNAALSFSISTSSSPERTGTRSGRKFSRNSGDVISPRRHVSGVSCASVCVC